MAQQSNEQAIEAMSRLYFFMLSDAYREFRESEVRWECYAASRYHFDDGIEFILETVGPTLPVDHPVWATYSEKLAEIGARVAGAERHKFESLAELKAVRQAFVRLCGTKHLDPGKVAGLDKALPARVLDLLREESTPASGEMADEAYRLLMREWDGNVPVGKTG